MPMTLDDYIRKYGNESGTKRYNGMQKLLISRQKTCDAYPYPRLTKEWFIWKYPDDGLLRFNNHVDKSRQSEENMIKRYGEDIGRKKWLDTVKKKNTVALIRDQQGEDAVKNLYIKRKESIKNYWATLPETERIERRKERAKKANETKKKRYGSKKKLDIFLEKYGELGHIKYAEYLRTIFKAIGYSKEAEEFIKGIIRDNKWLLNYTLYYRDSADPLKHEWFLSNKMGVNFYDFCIKEAKAIIEYDGAKWHPTELQAKTFNTELMEITGITYSKKYEKDQAKIQMAIDNGFSVFVIRSDFTDEHKANIINEFISYIKGILA